MLLTVSGPMPYIGELMTRISAPFGDPFVNYVDTVTLRYSDNDRAILELTFTPGYTDFDNEVLVPTLQQLVMNGFAMVSVSNI